MECKKIIIPIHSSTHQIQFAYAKRLEEAFGRLGHHACVLNLEAQSNPLYLQAYIEQERADLLVTIDCAGFELELLGDDLFYNSLCIPAMHFLTKTPWELKECLSQRMNFTMEFYTLYEGDKEFIEKYFPRVPFVHVIPDLAWKENEAVAAQTKNTSNHLSNQSSERCVAMVGDYASSRRWMEQIQALPQVFRSIAIEAIQKRNENQSLSEWKFLDGYLSEMQFQVTSEEFVELLLPVNLAFSYQAAVECEQSIACLCENQIEVHLYGEGWDELSDVLPAGEHGKYVHIKMGHSVNCEEIDDIVNRYEFFLVNDENGRGHKNNGSLWGLWNIQDKQVCIPLVSQREEMVQKIKENVKTVSKEEAGDKSWEGYLQKELERIFLS